ncbi:hypothetical protein YB2330_003439 [Saitoella coloradoensis]
MPTQTTSAATSAVPLHLPPSTTHISPSAIKPSPSPTNSGALSMEGATGMKGSGMPPPSPPGSGTGGELPTHPAPIPSSNPGSVRPTASVLTGHGTGVGNEESRSTSSPRPRAPSNADGHLHPQFVLPARPRDDNSSPMSSVGRGSSSARGTSPVPSVRSALSASLASLNMSGKDGHGHGQGVMMHDSYAPGILQERNDAAEGEEQRGYHILICATGSVASIKIPTIIKSLLRYRGVSIQLVLTKASKRFFDTAEVPACVKIWEDEDEWRVWTGIGEPVLHIELRRWADICLLTPLSANTLAKLAQGLADNLCTSVLRAWSPDRPILAAPAMNTYMWTHPATKRHMDRVKEEQGWVEFVDPVEKVLACGDLGMGGMADVGTIVVRVVKSLGLEEEEEQDGDDDGSDVEAEEEEEQEEEARREEGLRVEDEEVRTG